MSSPDCLSLCHPVTLSPCHPVPLSPCHPCIPFQNSQARRNDAKSEWEAALTADAAASQARLAARADAAERRAADAERSRETLKASYSAHVAQLTEEIARKEAEIDVAREAAQAQIAALQARLIVLDGVIATSSTPGSGLASSTGSAARSPDIGKTTREVVVAAARRPSLSGSK